MTVTSLHQLTFFAPNAHLTNLYITNILDIANLSVKVCSHTRFESGDFAERCDFNRNFPIFSNRHCWQWRQHIMFFRLCKHYFKVHLHRRCGPAILPSNAISIENFLSPRHRFEMDIPFEIYAPRN